MVEQEFIPTIHLRLLMIQPPDLKAFTYMLNTNSKTVLAGLEIKYSKCLAVNPYECRRFLSAS